MGGRSMNYCAAENTQLAIEQLIELLCNGDKDKDIKEQTSEGYALEAIMYLSKELQTIIQDKIDELWQLD